ncbi:unnamed protein product [Notodromas monacha]|uniref:Uncharacterized protein n=1 Tax=Notodromas monacha TaxID=399045 RepID=A0A7R9BCY5_9CRUS|nr:unnamed protein product [Notodromas monacha]CAG0913009.1 unnamed protein product [Notodromas monacha]
MGKVLDAFKEMAQNCSPPAPPTPPLSFREICETCCATVQSSTCPNPGEWRLVVGGVLAGAVSVAAVRLWQRCESSSRGSRSDSYKRKLAKLRGMRPETLEFRKQSFSIRRVSCGTTFAKKTSPEIVSSDRDSGGSSKEGQQGTDPKPGSENAEILRAPIGKAPRAEKPELQEVFMNHRRSSLVDQRTGGYGKETFGGPNFDISEDPVEQASKKESEMDKKISKELSQVALDAKQTALIGKGSKEPITVSDLAMGGGSAVASRTKEGISSAATTSGQSKGTTSIDFMESVPTGSAGGGTGSIPAGSGSILAEEAGTSTRTFKTVHGGSGAMPQALDTSVPPTGLSSATGDGLQSYMDPGADESGQDGGGGGGEEEQTAASQDDLPSGGGPDEPDGGDPDGVCPDPPVKCEHVSEYIEKDEDELEKLKAIGAFPSCGLPVFPICPPLSAKQQTALGNDRRSSIRGSTSSTQPSAEPPTKEARRSSQTGSRQGSTKTLLDKESEFAPCVDDYALSTTQDDGTVTVFVHTQDGREPLIVRTAGTCPCPQCLPRPPRPSKGVWESILDTFWPIENPPEVGCAGKKGFATVALTCCQAASALGQGMSFADIGCCYERFILVNKALDGTTVRTLKKYFTVIPLNVNECNPHEFSHASAVAFLWSLCEFRTLVYFDPTCKVVTRECEDLLDIESLTVNLVVSDKLTSAQECQIIVLQPSLTRYEAMKTALDNQAESAGDCSQVNLCSAIVDAFGEPNYLPWQPQKIVVKEMQLIHHWIIAAFVTIYNRIRVQADDDIITLFRHFLEKIKVSNVEQIKGTVVDGKNCDTPVYGDRPREFINFGSFSASVVSHPSTSYSRSPVNKCDFNINSIRPTKSVVETPCTQGKFKTTQISGLRKQPISLSLVRMQFSFISFPVPCNIP